LPHVFENLAATRFAYLPFDIPVERFIQSVNFGPLVQVFTFLDWIEGTRQQILGVAGILLVAGAIGYVITFTLIARVEPDAWVVASFGAIPFTLGLGYFLDSTLIRRDLRASS